MKKKLKVEEPIDLKAITIKDVLNNIIDENSENVGVIAANDEIFINNTTLWELCDICKDCDDDKDIVLVNIKTKIIINKYYPEGTLSVFELELRKLNIVPDIDSDSGERIFKYIVIKRNFNKNNTNFSWLKEITLDKLEFYMNNRMLEYDDESVFAIKKCLWVIRANVSGDWTLYDLLYTDQEELCDWTFMDEDIMVYLKNTILSMFGIFEVDTYKTIDYYEKDPGNFVDAVWYFYYTGTNLEYNKTLKNVQKLQIWKNKVDNTYIRIVDSAHEYNAHKNYWLYNKCKMKWDGADVICDIDRFRGNWIIKESVLLDEFEFVCEMEDEYGHCGYVDDIMLDILMSHD